MRLFELDLPIALGSFMVVGVVVSFDDFATRFSVEALFFVTLSFDFVVSSSGVEVDISPDHFVVIKASDLVGVNDSF